MTAQPDPLPISLSAAMRLCSTEVDSVKRTMIFLGLSKEGFRQGDQLLHAPTTDPDWWQDQRHRAMFALARLRQVAQIHQARMDRFVPDYRLAYELLVLVDDLHRDWLPMLVAGPFTVDDSELWGRLFHRLDVVGARWRYAGGFAGSPPGFEDLNLKSREAFDFIKGRPHSTGKMIARAINVSESYFLKIITKKLIPFGLVSKQPGYCIAD